MGADSTTHVIIDRLSMFSHVSLTHAGVGWLIVGPCWPWTDVFSLYLLWCISYIYPDLANSSNAVARVATSVLCRLVGGHIMVLGCTLAVVYIV